MAFEGRILCFNAYDEEIVWKNRDGQMEARVMPSLLLSAAMAASGDKVAELGSLSKRATRSVDEVIVEAWSLRTKSMSFNVIHVHWGWQ